MIDTKFRLVKFRLKSGRWIYLKGSPERIKKLLKRLKPADAYMTQACFVDSLNTEKKTYQTQFIGQDLVFDFDEVSVENVKKLIKFAEKKGWVLNYILETSRGNFQVSYQHPLRTNLTGIERLKAFEEYNRILFDLVRSESIEICDSTINPLQVVRLPFSTHHSGFKTRVLTKEELNKRQDLPLEKSKVFKPKTHMVTYQAITDRTNKNRSILYIKYEGKIPIKRLLKTQKNYKTGTLYILNNQDQTYPVISLKTFDDRRLQKIRKTLNKKDKAKFRFIRISQKISLDGEIISEEPTLEATLESNEKGQYSRTHLCFIKGLKGNLEGKHQLTGWGIKIYEVNIKEKVKEEKWRTKNS